MTIPAANGANIIAENEARRISMLRMQLLESHPFWGYLLMQVRLIQSNTIGSIAATDCIRNIFYDPEKTSKLSIGQLGFILVHEIGHMVYESGSRKKGRDLYLWNVATDYAINRIVSEIPRLGIRGKENLYDPIPGILLDKKYDGMIAETIYETLAKNPPDFLNAKKITIKLEYEDESEGKKTLELPGVMDHGGGIDIHLPVNLSEEEKEELYSRIQAAVNHWQACDKRGNIPGDIERSFSAGKPKVDWKRLLRIYVSSALTKDDYSLARPNKRWLGHGFIVPGITGEEVPLIVVALDTSGSMSQKQISNAVNEVRGIAEGVADFRLLVCDHKVQEIVTLEGLEDWIKKGKAKGGGGTSHIPVFNYMKQQKLVPDLFIGLTDLFSEFPKTRPNFPVLWGTPHDHGKAPWGKILEIS